MSIPLLVQRLTPTARLPLRADPGAVGYDLYADLPDVGQIVLLPGSRVAVGTGIAVAAPAGTFGHILPRSGLAAKFGIDTLAGVVDPSYRGEVKVILHSHGDPLTIRHGDRIAQLVLQRVETPEVVEVPSLDETARGAGGFGSTGQ